MRVGDAPCRIRMRALIQPPNVGRHFRELVVQLMIAARQAVHLRARKETRVELDVRERHVVVIAAVIDEDGNVARQALGEIRSRVDVVGFPSARADERRTDEKDRPQIGG